MSQVATPPQTKQNWVSCGWASHEIPPSSTIASSSVTSSSETPLEPTVYPTKNTQKGSNDTTITAAKKKQASTTKASPEKTRKVSQRSKFTFVMHDESNVLVAAVAGGNTDNLLKPKVKRSTLKHHSDNQLKMIKLEQEYLQIEIQKRRNQRELDRMDQEEKEKATLATSPLLVSIALAQQQQQHPSVLPAQW